MKVGGRLEAFVERLLTTGLVASAILLTAGLLSSIVPLLYAGILLLMVTPGVRVLVLTIGLLHRRDYVFAALSLSALLVLALSATLAFHR
jgi:uncharacterized membrane protein